MIKFSIVTVCLNSENTIRQTIESVTNQNYSQIEYIIIDGDSSDETLNIISNYRSDIDVLISEPDNGIYSAMNKGLRASSGDVIFFLNADDMFVDFEVIREIAQVFHTHSHLELLYGNVIWDIDGNNVRRKSPATINRKFFGRRTLIHQTIFTKRSVFEKSGLFSENLRVVSDYQWLLTVFLRDKPNYLYYDRDICLMGTSGRSWTTDWEAERRQVMKQYFNTFEILHLRSIPILVKHLKRFLKTMLK